MLAPKDGEMIELAKIGPGDSFGELGLLKHVPRAATIYCINSCITANLKKRDYRRILSHIEE